MRAGAAARVTADNAAGVTLASGATAKLTVARATRPFFDTRPDSNGSLTEATCGPDRSRAIEDSMASRSTGSVTLAVPVLAKTTSVEGATSAGIVRCSWVRACWIAYREW